MIFPLTYFLLINNNYCKKSYRHFGGLTKIWSKNKSADLNDLNNIKTNYIPKTDNQKYYKESLNNPKINLLFCVGPAGTGKTLFACQYAIQLLQKNKIERVIITRPTITIEENMGFLPGDIKEKMYPWTIPIFDIFREYYSKKEITSLVHDNIIEIVPLGFMQGRTFKRSIIIADEMQNSSPNQMFMLLTRIGEKSKMIITGDLMQTSNSNNGLYDITKKLNNKYVLKSDMIKDSINIINMENNDIQRHPIVFTINSLYAGSPATPLF